MAPGTVISRYGIRQLHVAEPLFELRSPTWLQLPLFNCCHCGWTQSVLPAGTSEETLPLVRDMTVDRNSSLNDQDKLVVEQNLPATRFTRPAADLTHSAMIDKKSKLSQKSQSLPNIKVSPLINQCQGQADEKLRLDIIADQPGNQAISVSYCAASSHPTPQCAKEVGL